MANIEMTIEEARKANVVILGHSYPKVSGRDPRPVFVEAMKSTSTGGLIGTYVVEQQV